MPEQHMRGTSGLALTARAADFLSAASRQRRRRIRLRRLVASVLVVLTVASVTASVIAMRQTEAAKSERDTAVSRQLVANATALRDTRPGLARQLSVLAYQVKPTQQALGSLIEGPQIPGSFAVPQDGVSLAYSPSLDVSADGRLVAVGAMGQVLLHDTRTGRTSKPLKVRSGYAATVAISPDGHTLAAGDGWGSDGFSVSPGTVVLWDVSDPSAPQKLAELKGHDKAITSVSFSDDSTSLVSSSIDGAVFLWDIRDPRNAAQPTRWTNLTALSSVWTTPDGRLMAATAENELRLWTIDSATRHSPVGVPLARTESGYVTHFSPEGNQLIAYKGNRLDVWDLSSPEDPHKLWQPQLDAGSVRSAAVIHGGDTLLALGSDRSIHVWDQAGMNDLSEIAVIPTDADDMAVSRGGQVLVTSSRDGTIRMWDFTDPALPGAARVLHHPSTGLNDDVLIARDGKKAVTVGDGHVRLWGLRAGRRPVPVDVPMPPDVESVGAVAISPDGRRLATAHEGSILVWDISDHARPTMKQRLTTNGPNGLHGGLAFSPDGHLLAMPGPHGTILLWTISPTGRAVGTTPLTSDCQADLSFIGFADNGSALVGQGNNEGTPQACRWDMEDGAHSDGRHIQLPSGSPDTFELGADGTLFAESRGNSVRLYAVSPEHAPELLKLFPAVSGDLLLSPDNTFLAVSGATGSLDLWGLENPTEPFLLTSFHSEAIHPRAYDAQGTVIAFTQSDGDTALFDLDPETLIRRTCALKGPTLSAPEWQQFVSGRPYAPPCD